MCVCVCERERERERRTEKEREYFSLHVIIKTFKHYRYVEIVYVTIVVVSNT